MQPLDRSVFRPFKTYYNKAMNDWMAIYGNVSQATTIYDVAELIGRAFPLALSQSKIINGFKIAGLHPVNEYIF